MREGGVDVRCFNPPRLDDPLGMLARDHRKCVVIDGQVAFVMGLCVGKAWEGSPEKGLAGWRDTGIEIRGPAVADVARAFARRVGGLRRAAARGGRDRPRRPVAGDEVALRVVATTSGTSGLYRLDALVAALARSTLWLTDAYYAGTPNYVQALRAAARDGVDVRLLVPGAGSDLALMQAISRAGYRPLLDGGVRVFEWNGPMLHAKTAVADARWARVGSTNLNPASWIGQLGARRRGRGREVRPGHGGDVPRGPRQRDGDRARAAPPRARRPTPRRAAAEARRGRQRAPARPRAPCASATPSARRWAAARLHGPAERRLMITGLRRSSPPSPGRGRLAEGDRVAVRPLLRVDGPGPAGPRAPRPRAAGARR